MVEVPKNGESSTSNSKSPKKGSIPLYLINGVATLWDAQVAATLHCKHNISGLRAGTLPGVAQQNGFLGLPITSMREETAYLVQQGIAHLVPLSKFPTIPTKEEIQKHTLKRIERIKKLELETRIAENDKQQKQNELFEKGGEKAKLKREARAKAKAEKEAKMRAEQAEESLFDDSNVAVMLKNNINTDTNMIDQNQQSIIPNSSSNYVSSGYFLPIPSHPVILPSTSSSNEIIQEIPSNNNSTSFSFPKTQRDKGLNKIFTNLQKKGYRIGLGPRFGGEYLIYPGDYLRYHAHFTSQILINDESIKPKELVAWGRLGTGTKKAGLLCCYNDQDYEKVNDGDDDDDDQIEYYSLEWANFG
ncbi:tRNA-intron endonuclease [Kwoniella dendrophila CBS 6074]|uniref:tRNA-splicing endonuclease subunit Sen34 n=1 Tax=Kwoniella dendrophila CBS 6074 TaxID=1295534 RepID=A0AAX4JS54_9TREE